LVTISDDLGLEDTFSDRLQNPSQARRKGCRKIQI
jgi:hypothetical protein